MAELDEETAIGLAILDGARMMKWGDAEQYPEHAFGCFRDIDHPRGEDHVDWKELSAPTPGKAAILYCKLHGVTGGLDG